MNMDDAEFAKKMRNMMLSRRNVIVTSAQPNHRQIFREQACATVASYIVQKFAKISLASQDKLLNEMMSETAKDAQVQQNRILDDANDAKAEAPDNVTTDSLKDMRIDPDHNFNGYARPQVLIFTTSRQHAWRYVTTILGLLPGLERKKIDNFKHFEEEYAPDQNVVQFVVGGIMLLPDEVPMQMAD